MQSVLSSDDTALKNGEDIMDKSRKVLGLSLMLLIAFTLASVYNTIAVPTQDGDGGGSTSALAGPYSGYCKKDMSYTWQYRISTSPIARGDDVGQWYTLPWSLPFYGESKSRVYICSNGFLIFDPTPATNDWSDTLQELKARWKIAAFWDDLRTDVSGGIVTTPGVYVDVGADFVVITWEATRFAYPADSIKFQVLLFKNGNLRISLDDATNINNFTPTLGVSKGTSADFIAYSGEKAAQKTWFFTYDCGCFEYERLGPWPYVPQKKCLTSSGYVDHGYCYCGPPNSRNFAPDYLYWYLGDTYFWTDLKFNENLYSAAQGWSGKDFCYTIEYNMPRANGTVTSWWSNIPNVAWNAPTAESWAGVPTWEWDAHTFTPQNITAGQIYYCDSYLSMNPGATPGWAIGQESELYDDGWCFLCWRPEPNGVQLDYWKQYLGAFWIDRKGLSRTGCEPERAFLEILRFSGGSISVAEVSASPSVIKIRIMPDVRSWEGITTYISSRIDAARTLVESLDSSQLIPVTVTFNTPVSPSEYMRLVKELGIEVSTYNLVGNEGAGGSIVQSKQRPYNWEFEARLKTSRGVKVEGVTGFSGSIPAGNIKTLQSDNRVILVDPREDLTVLQLKQKYADQGYPVQVYNPLDLWIYYKMLNEN